MYGFNSDRSKVNAEDVTTTNLVNGSATGSVLGVGATPTALDYSTVLGYATTNNNYYQLVTGIWNTNELGSNNLFIIGNGTDKNNRSNAFTVDQDGNVWTAGVVTENNGTRDIDLNISETTIQKYVALGMSLT